MVAPSTLPRLLQAVLERPEAVHVLPQFTFAQLPEFSGPIGTGFVPSHTLLMDSRVDSAMRLNEGAFAAQNAPFSRSLEVATPTSPVPREPPSLPEPASAEGRNGLSSQVPFRRFREAKARLYPKRPFDRQLLSEALSIQDRGALPTPQLPLVA